MEQKVLFTASTWSHISNFHRPYLAEFRRLGWRVDVACGGQVVDLPEASGCFTLPFEKSMTSPKNLAAVRLLRQALRREGYDAVITHTALAAFFTRLAVRGVKNRPAVVNVSHGYLFDDDTPALKRALLLGAERITAPVTDLLLTMNAWDYHAAQRHRLGGQVLSIPGMGVDFDRLAPAETGAALRGEWGFGEEMFLLLYAAEFSPRKNQAMLLRALAMLPPQVGLLLPGDGALRAECMALAERLGLSGRVVLPGQVANMSPWYGAADCAVSSSRSEGLPFNIMEAMHAGLPVVASGVKGHTDLIAHGENGLLFPFNLEAEFAAHIRTLLTDGDYAAHLGAEGRRRVAQFALPQVLPQVMAAYGQRMNLPKPVEK